jgi:tripartite-type tricarboxylate transporter receptor subunit TctC
MERLNFSKKWVLSVATCGLTALVATPVAAEKWPTQRDRIEFTVPFNTGGSADRLARALAGAMSEELNVPITVSNRPGGAGAVGATFFAKKPSCDGSSFLVMQATPFLANAVISGRAPVKWEDFHVINTQWVDYAIVAVPKDSPFKTLDDLFDAIEKEKGGVSSATMNGSGAFMQQLAVLEVMKLPTDQVRFVLYDGGGPVRTSVAGGQTDFSFVAATGSEPIRDRIRSIGIVNADAVTEWEGELINDVLKRRYNVQLPIFSSYTVSVFSQPCFPKEHPERYKTFVQAYEKVMKDPDFQADLKAKKLGNLWNGPDKSRQIINDGYNGLNKYSYLLKNR